MKRYKTFYKTILCGIDEEPVNDYEEYLKSDYWHEVREVMACRNAYRCEMCDKQIKLCDANIHHTSYKHLGDENLDELVFLCRDCHEKVHGVYKLRKLISGLNIDEKLEAYELLEKRFG